MRLTLNAEVYHPADLFILESRIVNPAPAMTVDFYCILDLGGGIEPRYYFYPGWTTEVDSERLALPEYFVWDRELLRFELPSALPPSGPFTFWGALTDPGSYDVLDIDMVAFYFAP